MNEQYLKKLTHLAEGMAFDQDLLMEMPYLMMRSEYDGSASIKPMSKRVLEKSCTKKFEIDLGVNGVVSYWFSNDSSETLTIYAFSDDGQWANEANVVSEGDTIKPVLCFTFDKEGFSLFEKNIYIHKYYRLKSLAGKLYFKLIDMGYRITSSDTHFNDSKGLWQNLAFRAYSNKNYFVRVYNRLNGDYIKTTDGNENYNGKNIDDVKIWDEDLDKMHIVLILSDH